MRLQLIWKRIRKGAGVSLLLFAFLFASCMQAPETVPSGNDPIESSGTETPEPSPETDAPEPSLPGQTQPETTAPETTETESTAPENTAPETTETESAAPETTEPETTAPETTPETVVPTPAQPDVTAPETPGIVRTDTTLYTYDEMEADLAEIISRYPDHLTLGSAGTTADGRSLYRVGFGNPNAERSFLIVAATHGREYMTAQLVMKQIEFYAANYETGSFNGVPFAEIFEKNYFVVVPMVNPDGVSISQLGEAGVRDETLRAGLRTLYDRDRALGHTSDAYERYLVRWKANANGVDLNRNFSPGWETVNERTAPSSDFYKGTAPGSEPETQALIGIVNAMPHLQAVISYHSYGDLVYWQYGQAEPLWTANRVLAEHIRNHAGHYLAGYSNEAGFTNWCIIEKGIRAVVVETGRVPTPLPLSEFADLWQRHRYTWTMLAVTVETR